MIKVLICLISHLDTDFKLFLWNEHFLTLWNMSYFSERALTSQNIYIIGIFNTQVITISLCLQFCFCLYKKLCWFCLWNIESVLIYYYIWLSNCLFDTLFSLIIPNPFLSIYITRNISLSLTMTLFVGSRLCRCRGKRYFELHSSKEYFLQWNVRRWYIQDSY